MIKYSGTILDLKRGRALRAKKGSTFLKRAILPSKRHFIFEKKALCLKKDFYSCKNTLLFLRFFNPLHTKLFSMVL